MADYEDSTVTSVLPTLIPDSDLIILGDLVRMAFLAKIVALVQIADLVEEVGFDRMPH